MFTPSRIAHAEDEMRSAVELLGLAPRAPVLDLCCGPGRHAVELARLGHPVTGVDRTVAYLDRARAAAAAARVEVELVEADARAFQRAEAFAAAILMYTSLGFFEDLEDDLRVLRNAHASLAPGGAMLIDLKGKEVIAGGFEPKTWSESEDGTIFLSEVEITGAWAGTRTRWMVVDPHGHRREAVFDLRLYSAAELESALRGAGFETVETYGDLDGGPYDLDATRLVAVARKGA
jgi:SAM-dependent methyltransferase